LEEVRAAVKPLDLRKILQESVLEIRGDGKAGGGLVLAFQSLASLALTDPNLHVQEWPFFSSARRGANIRSYIRMSARPVRVACEVTHPSLVLLMDEGAARTADFAMGVPPGGTFVLNSTYSPEVCAKHYRLSGRVVTISGDAIGLKHLKAQIGNVSAYVAMAHAICGFKPETVIDTFLYALKKRRIPETVLQRNREALEASLTEVKEGVFEYAKSGDHALPTFAGYGNLPVGAQTALRLSQDNLTAYYARSGLRLHFADPEDKCNGCGHCITNCPEGIIQWEPHPERGLKVTGSDVTDYCKLCAECISVCPENLFSEVPFVETWQEAEVSS
jgi:pyruvate ferredoxin oxidoreductase gamma subunit